MSYTVRNFRTKKAVKEAIKAHADWLVAGRAPASPWPQPVRCFNTGLGGDLSNHTGTVFLEGPHYPEPHKWYAQGTMRDGILVSIK